jgi:hypothetical protein
LIQQIENNVLVPRIVGGALDLNPLIVIIGVFIGASLAGLVGAVLAAPLLATTKLLGTYAWRKLFDLPPFHEPAIEGTINGPTLSSRVTSWFTSKSVREDKEAGGSDSASVDQETVEKSDSK